MPRVALTMMETAYAWLAGRLEGLGEEEFLWRPAPVDAVAHCVARRDPAARRRHVGVSGV
jgi:hypothetical protein